jgi:hypothetical protein
VLLVLAFWSSVGVAQDLGSITGLPLLVSVPTPPIPVRADGRYRLVYELHVTNASSEPVNLLRLEVWASGKLVTIEGEELSKTVKPTGSAQSQQPVRLKPDATSSTSRRIWGRAVAVGTRVRSSK